MRARDREAPAARRVPAVIGVGDLLQALVSPCKRARAHALQACCVVAVCCETGLGVNQGPSQGRRDRRTADAVCVVAAEGVVMAVRVTSQSLQVRHIEQRQRGNQHPA